MELRQIDCFLAVATELQFGKAAERLFLAQSSVSEAVRSLEQEIGGRLFLRTSRRVQLTDLGTRLRFGLEPAALVLRATLEDCRKIALGKPNRLHGVVVARRGEGGLIRLGEGVEIVAASVAQAEGAPVEVIIRQEAVRLRPCEAGETGLTGTVSLRSFSGARVRYVIRFAEGVELLADTASHGAEAALAPDTRVGVTLDPAAVFVMTPTERAP